MRMRSKAWFAASMMMGAFLVCGTSRLEARELALSDLRREATLSDPQISPDGTHVALLVGESDFTDNRVHIRIDMIDTRSGEARALALPFDDIASVRWSPDGTTVAFAAAHGEGPMQLYACSPSGAHLRRLTHDTSPI